MKPRNISKNPSAIVFAMESPRSQTLWNGIPAKLLALPLICCAISSAQATILAYDGFGDALNNTTLNAYDGTSAELGFTGGWVTAGGTNNTFTPPLFGNQVGIVGGVAPENTSGAKHVVRKAQFNVGSLTRTLSGTIDLTADGSHYMSFFGAASGFDFVCQVGLSNATHELMAGQAYNGNRGLTAYYGTNGTSVTTNVNDTNLNAFNWSDRNAFFTVQFTKTNSGTTNDVAVTITAYDLGNTVNVDISTLVEGTTKKTRTVNLTGVSAVFDKLKVKLDGTVEFDEIRIGQSLSEVITGGDSDLDGLADIWETTYFGNLSHDGTQGAVNGDTDGLTDLEEFTAGTNPIVADTDGDTLNDGAEVSGSGNLFSPFTPTSPVLADSDGDKVSDSQEVNGTLNTSFSLEATDPNAADSDGDGAKDYKELVYHSNPNDSGNLPTPSLFALISNTLQNGSFETRDGGTQITAKITSWDAAAPNDIDNWKQLAGPAGDSGAEAYGGTNGFYAGYFQDGNSAYNLTGNVAAEGSVYSGTWKQLNQGGNTITGKLGYWNGTAFIEIPASATTTNTAGGVGDLLYQIPAGSPAIGFPIGISIGSTGYWIDVDEVALNIAATGDDDGDGLLNLWEVANGLNPNENGTIGETSPGLKNGPNGALGDPDSDGYSNLAEQAGGSNPQLTASIPGDIDGDLLGDAWEMTNFNGVLNNPNGDPGDDPDGDKDTNLVEFTNSTNPNDKFSFYSSPADTVPNSWEVFYSIPTATTGATDSDIDGLTNLQEFTLNTNPSVVDTDIDGLSDGYEVNTSLTNPLDSDSDNDGLLDGAEVNTHLTGPNDADSDDDGYSDGSEITAGSNPLNAGSTPFNLGGAVILIDPTHNNGSFETETGGQLGDWGLVASWDEWTGVSTANGNSGTTVSGSATQGVRVGFLQGNNATYNMTTHVVAVGDIYTFQWDHTLRNSSNTVSLVWNNGGTVTSIVASEVTSTTVGNGNGTSYEVLAGDPAIGSTIGLGLKNNNSDFPEVDNFILIVTAAGGGSDSDSDGMTDTWETTYFGDLDETATGDFDNDGSNNLTEFRLGLIPNSGSSGFVATRSAAGLLTWPSVTGVTFRIERSTTLDSGSWTTLEAAFPGTAGTASYTDPSPPVGKAFYKIGLNP